MHPAGDKLKLLEATNLTVWTHGQKKAVPMGAFVARGARCAPGGRRAETGKANQIRLAELFRRDSENSRTRGVIHPAMDDRGIGDGVDLRLVNIGLAPVHSVGRRGQRSGVWPEPPPPTQAIQSLVSPRPNKYPPLMKHPTSFHTPILTNFHLTIPKGGDIF